MLDLNLLRADRRNFWDTMACRPTFSKPTSLSVMLSSWQFLRKRRSLLAATKTWKLGMLLLSGKLGNSDISAKKQKLSFENGHYLVLLTCRCLWRWWQNLSRSPPWIFGQSLLGRRPSHPPDTASRIVVVCPLLRPHPRVQTRIPAENISKTNTQKHNHSLVMYCIPFPVTSEQK